MEVVREIVQTRRAPSSSGILRLLAYKIETLEKESIEFREPWLSEVLFLAILLAISHPHAPRRARTTMTITEKLRENLVILEEKAQPYVDAAHKQADAAYSSIHDRFAGKRGGMTRSDSATDVTVRAVRDLASWRSSDLGFSRLLSARRSIN